MTLHKEMSSPQSKNQTNDTKTALNEVLDRMKVFGCNIEFESMTNMNIGRVSIEETDFHIYTTREELEERIDNF
jgi:hypothetical protein